MQGVPVTPTAPVAFAAAALNPEPPALSGSQVIALLAALAREESSSRHRLPDPIKLALDWGTESKQGPFPTQLAIWVAQIEDYFTEHRTCVDARCRVASHFLTGRAQLEYIRKRKQKGDGMTWDDLLALLTDMAGATMVTPTKNRQKVLDFNMVEAVYTNKKSGERPHPLEYGFSILEACMDDGHKKLEDPWRASALFRSLPQPVKDIVSTQQSLAQIDDYNAVKDFVLVNRDLFDKCAVNTPLEASNKRRATEERQASLLAAEVISYRHSARQEEMSSALRRNARREARSNMEEEFFNRIMVNIRDPTKTTPYPPSWLHHHQKKQTGRKGEDTYWIKTVTANMKLAAAEDGKCVLCDSRHHDFYNCTRAKTELRFPDEYFFYTRSK
jgi:hypothetical protein